MEVSDIKLRPHKNAKNDSAYIRTKKSVLMELSDAVYESKPMQAYDKVYESCGGVVGAVSCGSVPRNIKQVSNVKAVKKEKGVVDSLFAIMEECKKEQSHANPFIRVVSAAPEAMCVLARDSQLSDMARFCTDDKQFSIMGVDPTFNLGEFSVTVTTYRHLQLLHGATKKHPVMLDPMFVHQRKTFELYHFLASNMVGLCPLLGSLRAFGTDGEKALGDAFAVQFRDASHLLCFLHVKERISAKIRDLGIGSECAKLFLNDIFGQQQGTHLFCGLVDCESSEEFDEKLELLKDIWNEREIIAVKGVPEFHSWFTHYHATNMKSKMLRPVRVKVGLGDPPVHYTNNANESENAKIKSKVDYKKSELSVFCQKMKELVDFQTQNVERAFTMDSGPFVVAPGYVDQKENPHTWVKQSKAYKERAISRIHKICLLPPPLSSPSLPSSSTSPPSSSPSSSGSPPSSSVSPPSISPSSSASPSLSSPVSLPLNSRALMPSSSSKACGGDVKNVPPLSISWKDIGLSEALFSGMWSKAAALVADETAVTNAPGLQDSRMVVSFSAPRKPHLVTILRNGVIVQIMSQSLFVHMPLQQHRKMEC